MQCHMSDKSCSASPFAVASLAAPNVNPSVLASAHGTHALKTGVFQPTGGPTVAASGVSSSIRDVASDADRTMTSITSQYHVTVPAAR
jgi:hypothetical protein